MNIREEGPSCEGTGCVAVDHDDRVSGWAGGPRVVDEDARLVDGLEGAHLVTFIDKLPVVRDRDVNRGGTIGRHDDVGEVNQVLVTARDNEPNEKASMKGREECYVLQNTL